MKKVGVIMLLVGLSACHLGVSVSESALQKEFWNALSALERSGGRDKKLQEKFCWLAIECMDELRGMVLTMFPALRQRKEHAEKELREAANALEQDKTVHDKQKGSKRSVKTQEQQLERRMQDARDQLDAIEDEIESQLRAQPALAATFNKIQAVWQEWCD